MSVITVFIVYTISVFMRIYVYISTIFALSLNLHYNFEGNKQKFSLKTMSDFKVKGAWKKFNERLSAYVKNVPLSEKE
jgi:hypothetical protein